MALRATSLGPKPSLFFFVLFICFFLSFLLLLIEKTVSPLEKGIFCLFLIVSLCLSFAFFGLPLFQFLFLCLSLVLSFVFLLVCFLLVPCFCLFLYVSVFFAFVSRKEQHQNIELQSFIFINPFSVFPVLFSL